MFGEEAKIKWGNATVKTLSALQAQTPPVGLYCLEADPMFVDTSVNNFDLATGSPAIDKGTVSDVYDTFKSLYGLDIQVDRNNDPRPVGEAFDIGAYEAQGTNGGGIDPCKEISDELAKVKSENEILKAQVSSLTQQVTDLTNEVAELQGRIDAAIAALEGPSVDIVSVAGILKVGG